MSRLRTAALATTDAAVVPALLGGTPTSGYVVRVHLTVTTRTGYGWTRTSAPTQELSC